MSPEPGREKRYIPIKVLYLLGVVWLAALPLLIAVVLTALLPDVGRLRTDGGGWRLLHLLWIYPVFAVVTWLLLEPLGRRAGRATGPLGATVTETVLAWVLLTALLQVFFEHRGGAAIAAAVALAALRPFATLLERTAPDDDTTDAPRPA
ncbi:hypothetical protein GC089_00915 [Cellulomonas sp. JZ18]|uniref:hypothetical protein n=1 Tax=Cellulomonas sp. JZ18 TaxID=2654191 RepID=UPI0012D4B198|nr:hypothetical protein [Cellulomonas sp. JZ18]QGQ18090.1 hypothetical protein GC089_00915 [Cellulomonas sp. JZ18]